MPTLACKQSRVSIDSSLIGVQFTCRVCMQEQSTLVIVVDGFWAQWPIAQLQIPANRIAEQHMCGSDLCARVAQHSTPDAAEVSLQDHAVLLARCWHSLGWQAKPAAVQKHPESATLACFQHELFHTDCGIHCFRIAAPTSDKVVTTIAPGTHCSGRQAPHDI